VLIETIASFYFPPLCFEYMERNRETLLLLIETRGKMDGGGGRSGGVSVSYHEDELCSCT